jgi:hypothetical protein
MVACVVLARHDQRLVEERRGERAEAYTEQALALLRQAVAAGFKDAEQLKKDRGFEPLRPLEPFQKIVADLESKAGANRS